MPTIGSMRDVSLFTLRERHSCRHQLSVNAGEEEIAFTREVCVAEIMPPFYPTGRVAATETLLPVATGNSDRYEIALWARNLFDRDYLRASSNQPRFHVGATSDVTFGYGRIFGLSALARFGQ